MRLTVRTALLAALVLAGLVAAAPAQARFIHFTSPSGNIDCLGANTKPIFVSCVVQVATWPNKPPRPRSCDLDWVQTEVALANRRVSVGACRGDARLAVHPQQRRPLLRPAVRPLDRHPPIKCISAISGVTCRYKVAPPSASRSRSRATYSVSPVGSPPAAPDGVAERYAAEAEAVTRRAARTFHLASRLLPRGGAARRPAPLPRPAHPRRRRRRAPDPDAPPRSSTPSSAGPSGGLLGRPAEAAVLADLAARHPLPRLRPAGRSCRACATTWRRRGSPRRPTSTSTATALRVPSAS